MNYIDESALDIIAIHQDHAQKRDIGLVELGKFLF